MQISSKNIHLSLLVLVTVTIFSPWFIAPEIIGGDWWYLHPSMLGFFSGIPQLWSSQEGSLGGVNANYPFYSYAFIVIGIFVNTIGIPWVIVSKILYFLPFLVMGIFSVHALLSTVNKKYYQWQVAIGALLYTTNTYILLVASGGQMGVALAYSLAPFVVAKAIELTRTTEPFRVSLILGLSLAIQALFDIRLAYLTVVACGLFVLIDFIVFRSKLVKCIKYFCFAGFLVILLHVFWIVPFYAFDLLVVPRNITTVDSFEFFSFADFENSLGLMHPNWPENIFGKTYFMRWEYIFIAILAFSSLLGRKLIVKKNNEIRYFSLYFVLLAIIGIFLSKGTNEPFGIVNRLVYESIPGMNLFRDPTKFYLFVSLSYSVLIPLALVSISEWISQKFGKKQANLYVFSGFVLFWLILLKPVWSTELGGTFKERDVPQDYQKLAATLEDDTNFSRTFWVPTQSRFRYQSELHPLINSANLLTSLDDEDHLSKLKDPALDELLDSLSVKYVILPFDSEKEIFLNDRKYDEAIRNMYEEVLDSLPWLTKIQDSNVDIYENKNFKEHLWVLDGESLTWARLSSSEYNVSVDSPNERLLYFSETYHPGWQLKIGQDVAYPETTNEQAMIFKVPAGKHEGKIVFSPQQHASYGYIISLSTFAIALYLIARSKRAQG